MAWDVTAPPQHLARCDPVCFGANADEAPATEAESACKPPDGEAISSMDEANRWEYIRTPDDLVIQSHTPRQGMVPCVSRETVPGGESVPPVLTRGHA